MKKLNAKVIAFIFLVSVNCLYAYDRLGNNSSHTAISADRKAIMELLNNYTKSVSEGNQTLFESQLLDTNIPFSGVAAKQKPSFKPTSDSLRNYSDFKTAIFTSGHKYRQSFSNIKINQDGSLAQVSLDFETIDETDKDSSYGWKVLHLIKVHDQWKIVSEFYTGYAA